MQGKTDDPNARVSVPRPPTRAAMLAVEDADRLASQFKPVWEVEGDAEAAAPAHPAAPPDPPTIPITAPAAQEQMGLSSDGAATLAIAIAPVVPPKETKVQVFAEEPSFIVAEGIVATPLPPSDGTDLQIPPPPSQSVPQAPIAAVAINSTLPTGVEPPSYDPMVPSAPPIEVAPAAGFSINAGSLGDDDDITPPTRNTKPIVFGAIGLVGLLAVIAIGVSLSGGSKEPDNRAASTPASTTTAAATTTAATAAAATAKVDDKPATPADSAKPTAAVQTAPAKTVDINDLGTAPPAKPDKPEKTSASPDKPADKPVDKPAEKPKAPKKPGDIVRDAPF